jgi:hypothetical protein
MDTSTDFLFGEAVGALAAVERDIEHHASSSGPDNTTADNLDPKDKDAGGGGYGVVAASDEFSEALRVANDGLLMRLRLQNLYWLGDGFAFRRATRSVWGFVDGFVGRALAKVDSDEGKKGGEVRDGEGEGKGDVGEKKESGKKFGLLESLLEQTRDREELIVQTLGEISFRFFTLCFCSASGYRQTAG